MITKYKKQDRKNDKKKERKVREGKRKEGKRKEGKRKEGKQKEHLKPTVRQSMQSFSPIKDVKDGIILTKDGRYIKILEFSPVNFTLKSSREQNLIIQSFTTVLKQCPVKVQFKVLSKKADVEKYVKRLNQELLLEPNKLCRRLQQEYINLITDVSLKEGVSRRFFIIFQYETVHANKATNFREIKSVLNTVSNRIKIGMTQCGNEFIEPENDDEYVFELLYGIFSRKESEIRSFEQRMIDAIVKYMSHEISINPEKIPYIPVNDLVCPQDIDTRNSRYLVIDDTYYSFLYMPSDAYSVQAYAGWLSVLVNMGEGIDVDFFLEKQPRETVQRKIGQQIRINKAKITETQDTNSDFDNLSNAISSGYYLKRGLANNEDLYYMYTMITVTAQSLEDLNWRVNEIQAYMQSIDMPVKLTRFQCEQAFLSTLPICNLDRGLAMKMRRNILTSSAASAYPFVSFELSDENGILLGVNKSNSTLAIVDIFNSKKYKNANMAILGTSGAGKTFTMQCMALRMRQKAIQVFIIAPLKGHEFKRAADSIGGQYVKISAGSQNCINIMEIRKKDRTNTDLIDGYRTEDSILSEKIQSLHIFFSLLSNDISIEEKQLLDEALIKTYAKKGITTDNMSLEDPKRPGYYKEMPTLGDLHKVLLENPDTKRLATIINRYVSGSASSFNRQTNVNLDNKYVVLDISDLTKEMLPVGMFVVLDYVWDKAKEDRTKKKAIFLDELWALIGQRSNALAAEFVLEIFKIIRGYGGSAIAATQDLNDFFALENGKGIINNAKTKIILNLEKEEADRVQETLNLTDVETQNILKFQRGNGLISTNSNNVLIEFKASPTEVHLITTDRAELEKIAQQIEA